MAFFGENFVSGSQGHVDHGVCFWYILFLGHMVTLVTLCFCNIVSGSQSHAGHVGHVVFFGENFVSGSQGHVDHAVCFW